MYHRFYYTDSAFSTFSFLEAKTEPPSVGFTNLDFSKAPGDGNYSDNWKNRKKIIFRNKKDKVVE